MRTAELDEAKYIALTTFRRDGTPVTTPVWLAPSDDGYYVTTGAATGKYKRLRSNPAIEVTPCNSRGTPSTGATTYSGTAMLLDEEGTDTALAAVIDRYGLVGRLAHTFYALQAKVQRRELETSGLELTVDDEPEAPSR
jgi:PPOX class probable F420-dependent enzyme